MGYKKIGKIAVIGEANDAASLVFNLANTGTKIGYFNWSDNDATQVSILEILDNKQELLYSKRFLKLIEQQQYQDFLEMVSDFDWVIFSLNDDSFKRIKTLLMEIEDLPDTDVLISVTINNLSVKPPLHLIPKSIRPWFTGIRFFEPFRKCGLVEIVAFAETNAKTSGRIKNFCEEKLGKSTIVCHSTGFADRLICFAYIWALRTGLNLGLDLEQINQLTGKIMGWHGKGAIADIDLQGPENFYVKSKSLFSESSINEEKDSYIFLNLLVMPPNGYFTEKGLVFDPLKGIYKKKKGLRIKNLLKYRDIDIEIRLPLLMEGSSFYSHFYEEFWRGIFKYVSQLIEKKECNIHDADTVFREALGWELGLFEIWSCLDVHKTVRKMEIQGYRPDPWVYKMLENRENSFFQANEGEQLYYDLSGKYLSAHTTDRIIMTRDYKNKVVWKNNGVAVYDLGGQVLHIVIHTYRNIIDEEVAIGILKSIDIAEKGKYGLIIGGNGKDFTVGANLGLVFFAAIEKNYKKIAQYISGFQTLTSRIKYSDVPIVVVPKGLSLGGGCEFALHSDDILCHTETYMGLPEAKVGLVPAGGGTKEMAVRLIQGGASPDNYVKILFNILEGKISNSAFEAIELEYLSSEKQIIRNKNWQLATAKNLVSDLLEKGYQKPQEPDLCFENKSIFQHLEQTIQKKELTPFEVKLALLVANILSGGRSSHGKVSEQHFLDLEREAFLSQCGERDTLKRLKNILSRK